MIGMQETCENIRMGSVLTIRQDGACCLIVDWFSFFHGMVADACADDIGQTVTDREQI